MKFELPPLPYALDGLEPHLSAKTLQFHYGRHHQGYLDKLRGLIEGTPDEQQTLEELVRTSSGAIFNNAAQVWNHSFYWQSMSPRGGGQPRGELARRIEADFESYAGFEKRFNEAATRLFGSGYVWLSHDPKRDHLVLEASKDADSPLLAERVPLLGMDVWEHAYYLDYQNRRDTYARVFLEHLVNWSFAEENLEKAQ